VLTEVRDGSFVKRLMADYDAGSPALLTHRRALDQRLIETVGRHLGEVAKSGGT
jgi:ketol-acid reductoisomerase